VSLARFISITAAALVVAARGDMAKLTVAEGTGTQPKWVEPHPTLIPTLNIAPARGWPPNATPQAAVGTRVTAFASC
jgi:hypothetical protein